MNDLRAVASLTWSGLVEVVRSRTYVAVVVAGVALVVASVLFEELAAGEGGRMIADIGGAFVALVSSIIGIVSSISRLSREIETKRLYHVIFRPFSHGVVPLACFCSSAIVVIVTSVSLGLLLWLLGAAGEWQHPERAFVVAAVSSLEGVVVSALAVLFASRSSSTVASIFAASVFLLGRLSGALEEVVVRQQLGAVTSVLRGALYVVPRLDRFAAADWVTIDVASVVSAVVYAALYSVGVLVISVVLFVRREL